MKKKLFLAIACPILAIAIAATSFWFLWSNKAQTPVAKQEADTATQTEEESVFPVIPNEQIYLTSETNFSWAFDITDTEKMLSDANVVARVKVLSAERALFVGTNGSMPYTPLKVQVLEVMSGDLELGSQTLYFPGGTVTAEQYLEANPTNGKKIGLEDMTQSKRKKYYIDFPSEMDCDIKKNTEYVFLLRNDEIVPGAYFVLTGAYGTFTKDKKNVKTKKMLKSTKAGKAKVATITAAEK